LEAIEPVVRECTAASPYKYRMYCGTPLSAENDIEILLWQKSTMNEWVVQCVGCATHNILGTKNIGSKSIICQKCEKPLDVRLGRWFATAPTANILGFRIPQIALHRNVATPAAYASILEKQKDYSKAQFNNEVLGVSDSIGSRLISINHLKGLCLDYFWEEHKVKIQNMHGVTTVVAGVDYGGQSPTQASRTAIAIWGILPDGRLRLLYGKIYPAGHAIQDIDDIARICTLFQVRVYVGDSGEGMLANAQLRQLLGTHVVFGNRYTGVSSGTSGGRIKWNNNPNDPGYVSDRTLIIDQFMHGVMTGTFQFPNWSQFEPYVDDIMAAYEETTPHGKRVWKHAATRPDDFLHACSLGWLAARVATGEVLMYQDPMPTEAHDKLRS